MNDILNWLTQYSPTVVLLLVFGGGVIYVLKIVVENTIAAEIDKQKIVFEKTIAGEIDKQKIVFEKTIAAQIDAQSKFLELSLARRSAFEEKLLLDRFTFVSDFSGRLELIFHEIARIRSGMEPREGFYRGKDIPELTDIHGELNANRIILGDEFYSLLSEKEKIAWDAVNNKSEIYERWVEIDKRIRDAAERVFRISEIRA